jgi:hypothetical protein
MTGSIWLTRSTTWVTAFGALLMAMTVSFLAGRATGVAASTLHKEVEPAASDPSLEPPPWRTHGFRDGETVQSTCVSLDCNG